MREASWHIVTSEYPPDVGGVADFAYILSGVLPGEVHVWAPGQVSDAANDLVVHRIGGVFDRAARARFSRKLSLTTEPRILLLQWVPHGFGARSMNLAFCVWLWRRARFHGDRLEIVVHEPFLSDVHSLAQRAVALVHRLMFAVLIDAARRVYVTIPAWASAARPFAGGRNLGFESIPVPSAIEVVSDPDQVLRTRQRYARAGERLAGHFGACGGPMLPMLVRVVPPLLRESPDAAFVLIGRDSEGAREAVLLADPSIGERLFATGPLQQRALSLHLQACDLLVQPYPDGVSGRRTSLMAALCHGAAIVGTSGHLTEEFWSGSGALELRDANGTDDIVRCASSLLENDPARAAISRRARELYEERFSVARLAALFERR